MPRKIIRVVAWSCAGLGTAVLLGLMVWLVWKTPSALYPDTDPQHRANAQATTRTWIIVGATVLATLGISLAVTGRTHRPIHQQRFTDRYAQAIELLGSQNVDQRRDGIDALERLALDSARHYPRIIEILSAYVALSSESPTTESPEALSTPTGTSPPAGTDIQAALTVLDRLQTHDPMPPAATPPTGPKTTDPWPVTPPAQQRPKRREGHPRQPRAGPWELPAGITVSATGLALALLAIILGVNHPTSTSSPPPTLTPQATAPTNPAPTNPAPDQSRARSGTDAIATPPARTTEASQGHPSHRAAGPPQQATHSSSTGEERMSQPDQGLLDELNGVLNQLFSDVGRHVLTRIRSGATRVLR